MSDATVATPSSASSRHAPSSKLHSGIISAPGWRCGVPPLSHPCPNWSSRDPARPDRHGFCPSYLKCSQVPWNKGKLVGAKPPAADTVDRCALLGRNPEPHLGGRRWISPLGIGGFGDQQ